MKNCKHCNKEISNYKIYCTNQCQADFGKLNTPFEQYKTDKKRKEALIRLRGHRCEVCNNTEWCDLPIPLEIDHINGNHTINTLDNVRLLCPNCHAQTPTYKARNKGNGRAYRRINSAEE